MAKCEAHHICQCLGEKMKALETANRKIMRENDKLAAGIIDRKRLNEMLAALNAAQELIEPFAGGEYDD